MGKHSMKNHRPTKEMRVIQVSAPWQRWKRKEIPLWQAVWDSLPVEQKIEPEDLEARR